MRREELAELYRGYIACLNAQDWANLGRFVDEEVRHNGERIGLSGYRRMIKAGIVDPAKVVRTALQDACSIAALLITAEAMITDIPAKDAAPAGGGGMGGMGY